ncbi:MAG: hypothetical protein E6G62_04205 [Actinobacteria bacterium]|nr:MAG: hypothetical protein E6G62_04205 [Actinomycetota bacterium]
MAQISRPFQIAFVAMALIALVWLLALRGHSSSSGSPGSAPASNSSPAAPSSVYHGSAPGVEGLSRAVAKAHGAVATSQQNAQQLAERSAKASGEAPSASSGGTAAPKSSPAAPAASSTASSHAAAKTAAPSHPAVHKPAPKPAHSTAPAGTATPPSMQLKVEAELKQGKIVTVLFWNPKGTDDQAVNRQLQSVGGKLRGGVAVHDALASQVGSFGTIIRGVKVYGTPTVMIINKHGQAKTLTGYTDAYAIEQAISEARRVK